jgi:hypothetical protein
MEKERLARPRHARAAGKHVVQPTRPNFYDKIYNYFDLIGGGKDKGKGKGKGKSQQSKRSSTLHIRLSMICLPS